jgi:RimJ/RimL family protein N-acetyltransferase
VPSSDPLPVGEPVAGSFAALRPRRGPFAGRLVTLRALDPAADVDELFARTHGSPPRERVWTYMFDGPFASRAAMLAWLERVAPGEDPLFLCVADASGLPCGLVSFLNVRTEMRVLELGNIWYVPEVQRSRVNTEAVFLMLRESFDVLGYRRVEWKCDSLNARSRQAALRLGFRFEGVFAQHMIVKGRNRDTAWYAMLDRDWPRVRANFERYLASAEGTVSLAALNEGLDGGRAR